MADPKELSEAGWKTLIQKHKVKDNGLQKALAAYSKLPDESYSERLKLLGQIEQLAGNLKKAKECMSQADVTKYLTAMLKVVDTEVKEAAAAQKKAEAAAMAKPTPAVKSAPPKPDPKMLDAVFEAGLADGFDGLPNKAQLFAKAPPFKSKYEDGYNIGVRNREKGPQTSMSPISAGERQRSIDYTKRKQLRKEFIQYLNQWWDMTLPENL